MATSILDAERLTFAEAAERAGVHHNTVWRWATAGVQGHKLPSVRLGGRRFVLLEDLEAFVMREEAEAVG